MAREQFLAAVREYCNWAESPPQPPNIEAETALRLLLRLHLFALDLPDLDSAEPTDQRELSLDEWKVMHTRFGALPFQYYATHYDPHNTPSGEPEVGDIADDLADVYQDLINGLALEDAGYSDAATWHWRFLFWSHWGRHASGAIRALQVWVEREAE